MHEDNSFYKSILSEAAFAVIIKNIDGQVIETNTAAQEIFGYTETEFLLKRKEDLIVLEKETKQVLETDSSKFKKKLAYGTGVRKNGENFPVSFSFFSVDGDNRDAGKFCFFVNDLSEEIKKEKELERTVYEAKLLQDSLVQEHTLLRTLIDNLPVAIFVKDNLGRKLIANKADLKNIRVETEEEIIGKTDLELFDPASGHLGYDRDLKIINTGQPSINDLEIFTNKDGVQSYNLTSKFPIIDTAGNVTGLVGISRDITAQRAVEEKLKLIDFAFEQADVSIFLLKSDASFYNFNKRAHTLLGYTREEMMALKVEDIDPNHKAIDWPIHWAELREKKTLLFTSVQKKKDGSLIDVEIKANLIKYGDSEINCAFVTNITERKRAEVALQRSNERFEYATLATSDMIWESDLLTKEVFFSKNFELLFGYTITEAQTTDNNIWRKNIHPEDVEKIKHKRIRMLQTHEDKWDDEYRFKKANGKYAWVLDKTLIIRNEAGKPIRLVGAICDITTKRETEQAFAAMAALQKSILDSANFSIISTDVNGIIQSFNEGAEILLGYKAEEVINKQTPELIHDTEEMANRAKELTIELGRKIKPGFEVFVAKAKLGISTETEWTYIHRNGYRFPVSLSVTSLHNYEGGVIGYLGIAKDITFEKQMQEELRISYEKLEETINELRQQQFAIDQHDIVSITDVQGMIIYANDSFCKISKYSKEELIGQNHRIIKSGYHQASLFIKMYNTIANGDVWKGDLCNKAKDGTLYWVGITIVPYMDAKTNKPLRYVSISTDITDKKLTELEREKLLREVTNNNRELKQFSYITSHNLRAPLTNLLSICNLIKTETIKDPLTIKLIDGFKRSTHDLNDTLNDLINILIIKENIHLPTSEVTFAQTLEKVTLSINKSIERTGTIIHSDFSSAPNVNFNPAYLESVFLNLITNSLKYAKPEGHPIIQINTSTNEDGTTKLIFSDNGIGMDMERVKNKIFGLYQRFHTNSDSKGIGLYLIYSQITALGGKIEFYSEVNIGTTFTLTFK